MEFFLTAKKECGGAILFYWGWWSYSIRSGKALLADVMIETERSTSIPAQNALVDVMEILFLI